MTGVKKYSKRPMNEGKNRQGSALPGEDYFPALTDAIASAIASSIFLRRR